MIFALLLFAAASASAQNNLTGEEKETGWILLFDGRDASGWRGTESESFPSGCWKVEDGCLRTKVGPEVKIREDLVSRETFRDFEMSFEFRLSAAANTGVKYLVQKHIPLSSGHDYAVGFEMQLIDDNGHPDARRAERRAGAMYGHLLRPRPSRARSASGIWGESCCAKKTSSIG